jgi:hypothetical protein
MTLPLTGPISLLDIAAEFGGVAPHSIDEYFNAVTGIPLSGTIGLAHFYGTSANLLINTIDGGTYNVAGMDFIDGGAYNTARTNTVDGGTVA